MTKNFHGTLWLSYKNKTSYSGTINRCVLTTNELVLQFNGNDSNDGPFSGMCRLSVIPGKFRGKGNFTYPDKTVVSAEIELQPEREGDNTFLSGSWHDEGDDEPYDCEIELIPTT